MTANRAGGRCDVPTPTKSPVSRPCSPAEEMPSSVESGAGPSLRGVALGMKRRGGFKLDIEDVGSDASGSKSRKEDESVIGYEAMQLRIAHRKKEREREKCAAGNKPVTSSNKKKRVNKTKGGKELEQKENETKARELTSLLARALKSTERHEETDYPKQPDCAALLPLAMNLAKVYEPCSKLVNCKQTELIAGLGGTYSQTYDIRSRRRESPVDWWTKVLYRLDWCDNYGFPKCGSIRRPRVLCIWPSWRPMSEKATSEARAWGPGVAIEYWSTAYAACTYVQWPNKTPPLNAIGL